eukprot:scaffold2967_cov112-Skeletonema_dohrnii-CCMP3373.AAC.8
MMIYARKLQTSRKNITQCDHDGSIGGDIIIIDDDHCKIFRSFMSAACNASWLAGFHPPFHQFCGVRLFPRIIARAVVIR